MNSKKAKLHMQRFFLSLQQTTLSRAAAKAADMAASIQAAIARPFARGYKPEIDLAARSEELLSSAPKAALLDGAPEEAVGIIADQFLLHSFEGAMNLIELAPESLEQQIENVDIVLYTTCWEGKWKGEEGIASAVLAMKLARQLGKKAVFLSIEDPPNYKRFLRIAKEADYIFTAAKESLECYIKDTRNSQCFLFEYAANPFAHSPYNASAQLQSESAALFAGSWMRRYKSRCKALASIFEGALAAGTGLAIADRNSQTARRPYPVRFLPFVNPGLPHCQAISAHKLFSWGISANSVVSSQTMCSMRTYELLAVGVNVISTYAVSVANCFPNIFIAVSPSHASEIFSCYSRMQLFEFSLENIRIAYMLAHVCLRVNGIFNSIGLGMPYKARRTLVVCNKITNEIQTMFERQIGSSDCDLREASSVLSLDGYSYVCAFGNEADYEEFYLADLLAAMRYSFTGIASKSSECFSESMKAQSAKTQLSNSIVKAELLNGCESISPDTKLEGETFMLPKTEMGCLPYISSGKKKLAVIMPVMGNGSFAYYRAFRSLMRSSIFESTMVYIIDDGSPDEEDRNYIKRLARRYSNVAYEFLSPPASGSAARPRSVGIMMAREPAIAFLDPDNELIGDMHSSLLSALDENACQIAIASYMKASTAASISFLPREGIISSPREELAASKFRPHSIQAAVFSSDFIKSQPMSNPIGGAGQDTLFFYEAMAYANSAVVVKGDSHIYYDETIGSVTNASTAILFEKMHITEKCQAGFLKREGLIESYKNTRLDYFAQNWYIARLNSAPSDERQRCTRELGQILSLYETNIEKYKDSIIT
ncbi:MAG: glycosyltransferase [Eubacteriaceae bacterium]|nr:glycosyltransferase [Eubacteriaceae bacterium]